MQCSFEEKTVFPDGSFTHSTCISEAEIFTWGECYGLCYKCAFEKLRDKQEVYEIKSGDLK